MEPIDPDEPDETSRKLLGGLEYLAGDFDVRRFPGQAWPPPRLSRIAISRRIAWKFAGPLAAVAALIAVAFHFWPAAPSLIDTPYSVARTVTPKTNPSMAPRIEQSTIPRLVIVEDMDSYSIIDMTGDVPLVSFARRDSDGFDDATPVFVEPFSEPTTRNAPL